MHTRFRLLFQHFLLLGVERDISPPPFLYRYICCRTLAHKLPFSSNVGRQHYRLYAIHHIPTLRVLDFQRITKTEREKALRLSQSAAGAALEKDVQQEKTFVPGEGKSAQESFATSFTLEQKEAIRQLVANAKSPAEIEEIELSVQRGIFPGEQPATNAGNDDTVASTSENGDRKRKAEDEHTRGSSNKKES